MSESKVDKMDVFDLLYKGETTQNDIAIKFSVSKQYISKLKNSVEYEEYQRLMKEKVSQPESTRVNQQSTNSQPSPKYRLNALLRPYSIVVELLVNHYDQTWYKGVRPKGQKGITMFNNINKLCKILDIERYYFKE